MAARPLSVIDRAKSARGALLFGCGGGGDIVQTIPVANYLRALGVENIVLAEYAVKWWDKPGFVPMGCEIIGLDRFVNVERFHPDAALAGPDTRIDRGGSKVMPVSAEGTPLYEAVVADVTGLPVVILGIEHGAQGVLDGLRATMARFDLDLVITVDIGADALYSGEETTVQSPMVDAFSVYCARELGGVYALTGYACDAELPNDLLDRNIARSMQAGGYLGAHGLTPQDVDDLTAVLDHFPDEAVEHWARDAARGRLGTQLSKGLWHMYVSPLAAVTLFFTPESLMIVNPIPAAIGPSRSIAEAEETILANFNVVPETRLPLEVPIPTPPQIP